MIVKDEAHVIRRCLDSVRSFIDHWVIVDTGSKDGTQDVIREYLSDVPGEIFERPWRNFGHNRTEAIQLAGTSSDYLLFIDADDYLVTPEGYCLPELMEDSYHLPVHHNSVQYRRIALVRSGLPWRYVGVLHETVKCESHHTIGSIDEIYIRYGGDGGRSQVSALEKYGKHVAILEEALREEPDNARYVFYLAESYRDTGQPEKALAAYERRAQMAGFDQEIYWSLLSAARLAIQLNRPRGEIILRYLLAHESRPSRHEALGELSRYCRQVGKHWELAYLFASRAIRIPPSRHDLFVLPEWQEWRCLDEFAVAAYWLGKYEECSKACESLLEIKDIPAEDRSRISANLNFALQKLNLAPA